MEGGWRWGNWRGEGRGAGREVRWVREGGVRGAGGGGRVEGAEGGEVREGGEREDGKGGGWRDQW